MVDFATAAPQHGVRITQQIALVSQLLYDKILKNSTILCFLLGSE
jgi:hypothetical protein